MTDTDPDMMRRQQAMDARGDVVPAGKKPASDRHDSDAESAKARDEALHASGSGAGHAEDAVLEENKRSDYSMEAEVFEAGRTDARPATKPPLARNDRSILGR